MIGIMSVTTSKTFPGTLQTHANRTTYKNGKLGFDNVYSGFLIIS